MSDKIEPALSAAEWTRDEDALVVVGTEDGGERCEADVRDGEMYVDVWQADGYYNRCEVTRPAALIALANAALPDSDPRKITREKIAFLRDVAMEVGASAVAPYGVELAKQLDNFADALESYLPPET